MASFTPVALPADGTCIIWNCKKMRTHRAYCRKHYDELLTKVVIRKVRVKGFWQRKPNGELYYRPSSVQKRQIRVPDRELPEWKYREKPVCATPECDNQSKIRGLCRKCYERACRHARGVKLRKPVGQIQEPFAYTRANTS